MKEDITKTSQTPKVRRPVRVTEVVTPGQNGKKTVVKTTFFNDGSSIEEEKIFENNELIRERTYTTPAGIFHRQTAPATKILPANELLATVLSGQPPEKSKTKTDNCDQKPSSNNTENSLIVPNIDAEEGLVTRPVASYYEDDPQSSSSNVSSVAYHHGPSISRPEIVNAYVVPVEDQPNPTENDNENEGKTLKVKSIFQTSDGMIKKRFWLILSIVVIIIAVAGVFVGAALFNSKPSSRDQPTPAPTESPTLEPTVITECSKLCLDVVSPSDCPSDTVAGSLKFCVNVNIGELCDGESECGTKTGLNNCGLYHVYRRVECKIDQPWPVGITDNGFEYYVEVEEMDWLSHVKKAALNNAQLVSIHSHQERNFVVNQIRRSGITKALIGGLRKGAKDDLFFNNTGPDYWKWTDETTWDYEHWNPNQPDNNHFEITETVVELEQGMNDISPNLKVPAVYKRATSRSPIAYTYKLPPNLGNLHSCVMNNQMELFCMGRNDYGRLGIGILNDDSNIPTIVSFSGNKKVKSVALGYIHSCAILEDDSLQCWGLNSFGQIGVGDTSNKYTPQVVNTGASRTVKQVSLGFYHSCALLDDTSLKCWGHNTYMQLGTGSNSHESIPKSVNISPGKTVKQVACGGYHTCVVLDDGDLSCWGSNSHGQLGDGTNVERTTPVDVNLGQKVKMVSLGYFSTCAVLVDDTLKCWGRNHLGQLGIGSLTDVFSPTDVNLGIAKTVKQISSTVSGFHRCAIMNDNTLKCWGWGNLGQLGNGYQEDRNSPTDVFLNGRLLKEVSVGTYHTCAILTDESLICWGSGLDGQLGYEELANYLTANDVISLIF